MRANIPKLPMGAVKIFPDMSDADVRAWNRTEVYRMREYEAMANAMLISMLYYLMTVEHYGAVKLRRAWEGMIRYRAEAGRICGCRRVPTNWPPPERTWRITSCGRSCARRAVISSPGRRAWRWIKRET